MIGLPTRAEAAPYYFKYIDRISEEDVVTVLQSQLVDTVAFLRGISEEKSLYRYAPEKWSIRQVLNHVNDCERVFLSRAFWFARGFSSALPSFDQNICAGAVRPDEISWTQHLEEFQAVRAASSCFFRSLSGEAWSRSGVASDNTFTVRALAYIVAGHVDHHVAILRDRYL
jgi:hypothetical protein